MGIRYLNRHLRSTCSTSITKINLKELSNKVIVIDTSIYLYRFIGENALLENFYYMISIFRKYNISPLFIFDGKPPEEKRQLLLERKKSKKIAEEKYKEIDKLIKANKYNENELNDLITQMDVLKKQFIKITMSHVEKVKNLFINYGVSYFDAPSEADLLCAKLVIKKKAYACLSEDMDMFVYGCPIVLRYLSLQNENVIQYDFNKILQELDIPKNDFRYICVLSGTDYNNTENKLNLFNVLKIYKHYTKFITKNDELDKEYDFYKYIETETNHKIDICELYNILSLFNLSNFPYLKTFDKIKILNSPPNWNGLEKLLNEENFIFLKN
jgi:flap endonuclease-1